MPTPDRTVSGVRSEMGWRCLELDLVYSEFLVRKWGLPLPHPRGVRVVQVSIGHLVGRASRPVRFYVHDSLPAELEGFALRHLSGVASTRVALGVSCDPRRWWVDADPVHPLPTPDALWKRETGELVAVEYDAGYPKPHVVEKAVKLLTGYDRVVWAVPDHSRLARVRKWLSPELPQRLSLIVAPW